MSGKPEASVVAPDVGIHWGLGVGYAWVELLFQHRIWRRSCLGRIEAAVELKAAWSYCSAVVVA